MKLTGHALKRWNERFPNLDLDIEFDKSTRKSGRVGKKLLKRIRETCPAHSEYATRTFTGFFYRKSDNVIFVICPEDGKSKIVTVLPIKLLK